MTRRTSIETYRQIEAEGLLSKRRFQVYDVLFHHGPLTAGEIYHYHLKYKGIPLNSVSPRTAELLRAGCVYEAEERRCRATGRMCIAWDVNEKLPEKLKSKKAREEICPTCGGKGKIQATCNQYEFFSSSSTDRA